MIPTLCFLFYRFLTGGHEIGAIYYCIGGRIGKTTRWLLALLIFPLLMAIFPVKSPCTLTIIARCASFVLLVIADHGGCCQILVIWVNRICIHPLWKLIHGLLGCVISGTISLWLAVFLNMALFTTLVTFSIWLGKLPFFRACSIPDSCYINRVAPY